MSGAKKFDTDKAPLALLPFESLEEAAKVLQFGADKYGRDNWRGGLKYTRLISASLRHTGAFLRGEDNDPETGLSHLAHATCCLLFLLSFIQNGRVELDDRHKQ